MDRKAGVIGSIGDSIGRKFVGEPLRLGEIQGAFVDRTSRDRADDALVCDRA